MLGRHLQRKIDLPVDNCRVLPHVESWSLLQRSSSTASSRTNNLLAPKIGPLNFSASANHFTVPCSAPFQGRIRPSSALHTFGAQNQMRERLSLLCTLCWYSWHWTGSLHWLLDWASVCSRSHDQRKEAFGTWPTWVCRECGLLCAYALLFSFKPSVFPSIVSRLTGAFSPFIHHSLPLAGNPLRIR